jgi:hypothetical protein
VVKDYSGNVATAKRLIEKFGREIVMYQAELDDDDVAKPWGPPVAGTVENQTTLIGCFVPVGGGGLGNQLRDIASQLNVTLTQELLVAVASDTVGILDVVDSISDGGRAWKIHVRQELAPGPTSILFAFGLSG